MWKSGGQPGPASRTGGGVGARGLYLAAVAS
jgi:hypothetical protein